MITHNDAMTLRSELREMIFPAHRFIRCIGYFVVSHLLLSINSYGVGHQTIIPIILAILAAGSSSARIAQLVIAILAVMTAIPVDTLRTVAAAFSG